MFFTYTSKCVIRGGKTPFIVKSGCALFVRHALTNLHCKQIMWVHWTEAVEACRIVAINWCVKQKLQIHDLCFCLCLSLSPSLIIINLFYSVEPTRIVSHRLRIIIHIHWCKSWVHSELMILIHIFESFFYKSFVICMKLIIFWLCRLLCQRIPYGLMLHCFSFSYFAQT